MKRQMLIALSSAALMLGMSTSANCEENMALTGQQDSYIATIQTDELLPEILQNIDIEQVQILNEQQMQESIGAKPGGNSGQCRPRPHC